MLDALSDIGGKSVDWWFIYKLPAGARAAGDSTAKMPSVTTGQEYLYYDSGDKTGLGLSSHRIEAPNSALSRTLAALFEAAEKPGSNVGWIAYNEEAPTHGVANALAGAGEAVSNGILGFDRQANCGLWLVHTVPNYPRVGQAALPKSERGREHSFFCVTLRSFAAANRIARHMLRCHKPQIYAARIPDAIPVSGEIYALAKGEQPDRELSAVAYSFRTRQGRKFYAVARSRNWRGDFWHDLVGPKLKADFNHGTARRRQTDGVPPASMDLSLVGADYVWSNGGEPVRWTVSELPQWICVGDIGRRRGSNRIAGGAVCFNDPRLWLALQTLQRPGL